MSTVPASVLHAGPVRVDAPTADNTPSSPPSSAPPSAPPSPADAAGRFPALREILEYLDRAGSRIDLAVLETLLRRLNIGRAELAPACRFRDGAYARNIIARTPWFELVCLCWQSGQMTPIHDHEGSSCAFRVIEGVGTEIRYEKTPAGLILPVASTRMPPGYVCAAEDADIHQVANAQAPGTDLITLHIYSPPIQTMHAYPYGRVCEEGPATGVDGFDPGV
jgi:cysteine dioxygenase